MALAVNGEWQVEPEAVDAETQARFDEQVEQRLRQLKSELELNAKVTAAFVDAAGFDASKLSPEVLRELEQAAEATKAEPPPLPRE
jgi:hypothetical protein